MNANPALETPEDFTTLVMATEPNIYVNGLQIGAGTADITTLLQLNGKPVGVLNMSFTTAKSLAVMLAQAISSLEAVTGQEIMTTQRIETAVRELSGESK